MTDKRGNKPLTSKTKKNHSAERRMREINVLIRLDQKSIPVILKDNRDIHMLP